MRKMIAKDVPDNSVVRLNGEWGVLIQPRGAGRGKRIFDRWYAPAIGIKAWEVLEVRAK